MSMTEPGWYPEAADPPITRYWDGSQWLAVRVWDGSKWLDPSRAAPTPLQAVPDAEPASSEASDGDTSVDTSVDTDTADDAWTDAREIGVIIAVAIVAFLLLLLVAWTVFGNVGESSAPAFTNHLSRVVASVRL
jgi:hypothetical protein